MSVAQPTIPPESAMTVAPPANRHVWGDAPFLGVIPGQTYQGRVFIEVWDSTDHLVICGHDEATLKARAGAVLRGRFTPLRGSQVPGINEAAGGDAPDRTFLGRVVIEIWSVQAVVGITGSHPRVLAQARQRLGA